MKSHKENGIIYFDEPRLVQSVDFLMEHLDCDFIIDPVDDSLDYVYVLAVAENKDANQELNKVFKQKFNGYKIVQGMNSQEVNAID